MLLCRASLAEGSRYITWHYRLFIQVEAAPNSSPMLAVARNLRVERDREEQIQKQKHEQRNMVKLVMQL